jgi:hypothetical protein
MSDNEKSKHRSEADAELEREIRQGRKFTLEEAIARMVGPGAMKGESPITRKEQAEAEIDNYLRQHLIDASGTLPLVLYRRVKNSEILLENFEQPLVVLARCTQQVLDSEYLLTEVVREADAQWGRVLGERPYFEKEGSPPHPDDPYTIESVRNTLSELMEKLMAGDS